MQIVLQKRETTDGTLATGLLLGLWIGEVLATAEYWLLEAGSVGLGAVSWVLRRPVLVASAFVLAGGLGLLGAKASAMVREGRVRSAIVDLKATSNAAALYRAETGHWPPTLEKLVPRYLKALHADPWGRHYAFYRGDGGIAVVSAGADGDLGSPDDVTYVTPNKAVTCPLWCGSVIGPSNESERLGCPRYDFDAAAGGLRLAKLGPGILGWAGLQENDVILRVNGFSFATPEGAIEAYSHLQDAHWFDVALVRDGQPVHLLIDRESVESHIPQP